MKVVAVEAVESETESSVEHVIVSEKQYERLGHLATQLNPDMPMAFAGAHIIRTLLERLEDSAADLTEASSEEELTQVAARCLRERTQRRQARRD